MKKLTFFSALLTLLSLLVAAAEPAVVAVTAADIRADAGILDGKQWISTGQPDKEILTLARDAGFVAVVDLRGQGEDRGLDEPVEVKALGMEYVSLPVAGPGDVTFENAARLDSLLGQFDGPVLLHCASGNRVGALVALRASAAGASDDEAVALGKAAGLTRLESVVLERMQQD
jgi:uncharacterized protein (TIGR01244 family)